MRTVTVKFVVRSDAHADDLMNEIANDIGNHYGVPFISSEISEPTNEELQAYREVAGDD